MQLDELRGKPIAIWGAGQEGRAMLSAIASLEPAHVQLVDDNPSAFAHEEIADVLGTLRNSETSVAASDQVTAAAIITPETIIIRSPGFSIYDEPLRSAIDTSAQVTSSTDLLLGSRGGKHVIGITGSKGKSTTTSLTQHIMKSTGADAVLGGNIGTPLVTLGDANGWIVAEVSSFQGADLHTSPEIGVLTSLFSEHVDWHKTYENYVRDKLNLFAQPGNRVLFVNATDAESTKYTSNFAQRVLINEPGSIVFATDTELIYRDRVLAKRSELTTSGVHNIGNTCLAIAAADAAVGEIEIEIDQLLTALQTYIGLPHRLQTVGDLDGVKVIDDGLATNPGACVAGMNVFAEQRLTIFLGGYDRGVDYQSVAETLNARSLPTRAYLMGPAGDKINDALRTMPANSNITLMQITTLKDGISDAIKYTADVDVIALCPGGASFNEFDNYKQRSIVFVELMTAAGMKPVANTST